MRRLLAVLWGRKKKTELPPIEETAKNFKITEGEDYLDEIFEYDLAVSREFSRADLGDEYTSAYYRVINRLLAHGEHKFFVAVDPYGRYLGHVWICIMEDTVDFVPTAYIFDIETKVHGLGIGSALLKKAEEWAREKGASKVSLRVEINNPALNWYRRRGYLERAFILEKEL